jgi:hypothetical protein
MLIHGIEFKINWAKFIVGASFFVPCLDTEYAITQVKRTTKRLRYAIEIRVVIEQGIQGLRVWRIK